MAPSFSRIQIALYGQEPSGQLLTPGSQKLILQRGWGVYASRLRLGSGAPRGRAVQASTAILPAASTSQEFSSHCSCTTKARPPFREEASGGSWCALVSNLSSHPRSATRDVVLEPGSGEGDVTVGARESRVLEPRASPCAFRPGPSPSPAPPRAFQPRRVRWPQGVPGELEGLSGRLLALR